MTWKLRWLSLKNSTNWLQVTADLKTELARPLKPLLHAPSPMKACGKPGTTSAGFERRTPTIRLRRNWPPSFSRVLVGCWEKLRMHVPPRNMTLLSQKRCRQRRCGPATLHSAAYFEQRQPGIRFSAWGSIDFLETRHHSFCRPQPIVDDSPYFQRNCLKCERSTVQRFTSLGISKSGHRRTLGERSCFLFARDGRFGNPIPC